MYQLLVEGGEAERNLERAMVRRTAQEGEFVRELNATKAQLNEVQAILCEMKAAVASAMPRRRCWPMSTASVRLHRLEQPSAIQPRRCSD